MRTTGLSFANSCASWQTRVSDSGIDTVNRQKPRQRSGNPLKTDWDLGLFRLFPKIEKRVSQLCRSTSISLFPALVGGAVFLELFFEQLRRALSDPLIELPHALVLALAFDLRSLKNHSNPGGIFAIGMWRRGQAGKTGRVTWSGKLCAWSSYPRRCGFCPHKSNPYGSMLAINKIGPVEAVLGSIVQSIAATPQT